MPEGGEESGLTPYSLEYSYLVCTDCCMSIKISLGGLSPTARCSSECQAISLSQVQDGNLPSSWRRE